MKKLGLLTTVLLISTGCGVINNLTSPDATSSSSSSTSSNVVIYSAIGASDANGVGSSVPCLPWTECPTGMGYVPVLSRKYTAAGKTVTLQNLGFPGATISKNFQDIGNQVHHDVAVNFIADEMIFVNQAATLVTVFAGANDANAIASAAKAGLYGSDPTAWLTTQVQNFGKDINTLIAGIKARAPKARIVIMNLPNLAAMPYSGGNSASDNRVLQAIAVGMNTSINALTTQGVTVIDLMCDSRFYGTPVFSSDGFHPNDSGYALFADSIYAAAATTTPAAPKSSCSFMNVY